MFPTNKVTSEVAFIDSDRLLLTLAEGDVIICSPSTFSISAKT